MKFISWFKKLFRRFFRFFPKLGADGIPYNFGTFSLENIHDIMVILSPYLKDGWELTNEISAKLPKDTEAGECIIVLSRETPATSLYSVVSGDSLSKIATKFNTTLTVILELNPQYAANPSYIKIGWTVIVPSEPKVEKLPITIPLV
jgi:hypothetical protein